MSVMLLRSTQRCLELSAIAPPRLYFDAFIWKGHHRVSGLVAVFFLLTLFVCLFVKLSPAEITSPGHV